MPYDLSKFDLGDMLKSSIRLREAMAGASTLEIVGAACVPVSV